jgi:hypothetical protein
VSKIKNIKQGSKIEFKDGNTGWIGLSYNGMYQIFETQKDINSKGSNCGMARGCLRVKVIKGRKKTKGEY